MRIKDLADLADTTVRTIRYYHQLGLLAVPETGSTWRAYGFTHLTRLMRIRWLVESGVPLIEVPHMLGAPSSLGERETVMEDLDAVLASIDEKMHLLAVQRQRVETLRDRVTTQGRLSPLPEPVVRLYAAVLERPLPLELLEMMSRERDLLELACYRGAMPEDVTRLLEALQDDDLDELLGLWQECHQLAMTAGARLSQPAREEVHALAGRTVALAARVEADATVRLLRRAADLNRPVVRAAVDLAYPSPVYREFVRALMTRATDACPS
jgi:DNA-binding transcriptional MerR regulator